MVDKGAVFADNWRRVVWQNPSLDYAQKRPVNNSAIKIYDEGRIQNEEQQLKMLAKEHGLIFFFRSDCSYCHAMAPTLKMLSDKYGIEVLGVSPVDGAWACLSSRIPRRAALKRRPGGSRRRVPALFIGSKQTWRPRAHRLRNDGPDRNRQSHFVLTGTKPG